MKYGLPCVLRFMWIQACQNLSIDMLWENEEKTQVCSYFLQNVTIHLEKKKRSYGTVPGECDVIYTMTLKLINVFTCCISP